MKLTFVRGALRVGMVLSMSLVLASAARADDPLRKELAAIAKGIATALKGLGHDNVAVGEFTGPAQLATSSGPCITKMLSEELPKNGVAVKRVALIGVKGEFEDVKDKETGLLAVRIKGTVTNRAGQVLFTFSRGVFGDNVVAALLGATATLPPDLPPKERNAELEKSLDKPKVHIEGARVSTGSDSPYAIEILTAPKPADEYTPRQAAVQDGLAFVPLSRGEVFGVKLINRSPHDAAVTLTIDGINMYAFSKVKDPSTGRPKFSVVVLGPGEEAFVPGWHRTNEVSEEFVITEYARSAAAELHSTAPTGVITATFAAAWPKDQAPPADEPGGQGGYSRSADAVGRGAKVHKKYVAVERHKGVVRAAISVRYNK